MNPLRARLRRGAPRPLAVGFVCTSLAFPCVGVASAQDRPSIRTRAVTPADGLSSGVVTALYRDRTGFLWVGTHAGLNRYDGREFTTFTYDPADPASLADNHVRVILEDRGGSLWVGTAGGGLSFLEPGSSVFERVSINPARAKPDAAWVEALMEDRQGRLWVGTLGAGVSRLDATTGEIRRYTPGGDGSLTHGMVNVVYMDRRDRVWIGTDQGLNLWDPGSDRFESFMHDPRDPSSLPHDRVLSIAEDAAGGLWIGTESGLGTLDAEGRFDRIPHDGRPGGLSHSHVTALFPGPPGTIWVGTYGGGLNELDTSTGTVRAVQRADPMSGLRDDRIRRLAAGSGPAFWVGTWGGGVTRVSPLSVAFELIEHDPEDPGSLAPGQVQSIAIDGDGSLWVATFFNGVHRQATSGSDFVHFRHDPADSTTLSGDDANRLLIASSGHVWVGTWSSGLNRLDPSTGHVDRYPAQPERDGSLIANRVTALLEDRTGTLWVGTSRGLAVLDDVAPPGRFVRIAELDGDYVQALVQDSSGRIWAGTAGAGLVWLDPVTLEHDRSRNDPADPLSLAHDQVTALHEGPSGVLWVGTSGGGLSRVERGDDGALRFHTYGESDGVISNSISSITSDGALTLWVATADGLSVLTRNVRDNGTLDEANGLPSAEFTVGSSASSATHHYFGTPVGVVVAPRDVSIPVRTVVPVTVTAARALRSGRSIATGPVAAEGLPYGEVVQVELAVLDYEGHGDGAFEVLLEGLDTEWVPLGAAREIVFSGLRPGDYTLRVRGPARHGDWSEAEAPLRFSVVPPVWMTPGFRLLVVTLLVGAAVGAYQVQRRLARGRERAVRQKEDEFLALLARSHDLVSILDEDGRVQYLGPSVRRILGYEERARIGHDTREVVHPDDVGTLDQWMKEVFEDPLSTSSATIRIRAQDGSWRVLESVGTAFETDGGRRAIVNARDVTERVEAEARSRQLEQALNQRQKLEAIGTLAGGVAHDFNNLLTVIGGHATLLEEDAGDREATIESAAAIRRAQQSGAALTRQLLAFARKQRIHRRVLDLNDVLSSLDGLIRRLVGAQVRLDIDLRATRPWVLADEVQLEQVLINLVVNARDAMPGGGQIQISTGNRRVRDGWDSDGDVPPGDWVVVEVTDGGVGIGDDALPHIFEPFFTTKQRGQGTGLGLSTVYGIVTHFGGRVSVRTLRRRGTTFTVYLPEVEKRDERPAQAADPPAAAPARAGTVLVAEDDDEIRRLVGTILRKEGYRVLEARDGLDALRVLERGHAMPDLLVTDLIMPNMNGAELAHRVRDKWPDARVLYMTGYADGALVGEGLVAAADILHKPFSPSTLGERVRLAMGAGGQRNPYRGWRGGADCYEPLDEGPADESPSTAGTDGPASR